MTLKQIEPSDVLGDNYYIYDLTASNYTPSLNGTISISCTLKNVFGNAVSGASLTLYKNGSSVSSTTTNSSGVATWSNISCTNAGMQKFSIKDRSILVFVDNKISKSNTSGLIKNDGTIDTSTYLTQLKIGTTSGLPVKTGTNGVLTTGSFGTSSGTFAEGNHTHSGYASSTHTHGNLQSNGQVGSTAQANKNVVTDSNGKITTENKPTIPTAVSDLTNDSDFTTINDVLEYISENATLTIPTTGDDAGYLVLTIQ